MICVPFQESALQHELTEAGEIPSGDFQSCHAVGIPGAVALPLDILHAQRLEDRLADASVHAFARSLGDNTSPEVGGLVVVLVACPSRGIAGEFDQVTGRVDFDRGGSDMVKA